VGNFRYAAIRADGERIAGQMEAKDRQAVFAHLDARNCYPIEAVEVGAGAGGRLVGLTVRRPRSADIALFTRELAWLLRAGLTLSRALEVLGEEIHLPRLASTISEVRAGIRAGQSLNEALTRAGGVFSPYYINMVRMAEASGTLVPVLEKIADSLEREQKVRRKIVSALTYPAVLVLLAIGALVFILLSVVPRLKDLVLGADAGQLPDSARRIIALSDWLQANGWSLLLAVLAGTALLIMLLRRPAVRRALYGAAIRVPVLGSLLRTALVVQFSRALATLLSAGVDLPMALNLMRTAFGLKEVESVVHRMETALRQGEDFLKPLEESWLFPRLLPKMMRVGEETGNLAPSVLQASAMFEDKLETAIQRSLTILEPVIIICVSLMIAAIISSIIGAIISVNDLAL
jgi:type II secretory pathway component PulF